MTMPAVSGVRIVRGMGDKGQRSEALAPALEGGDYQVAPITALALARWPWAVAGLVIGAVLGWFAVSGGGYCGTAVLQARAADTTQGQDGSTALVALATSDKVLDRAVASLRPGGALAAPYTKAGGALPASRDGDESPAKDYLAAGLATVVPTGSTTTVQVAVTRTAGSVQGPGVEANAIAYAVRDQIRADADDRIAGLRTELKSMLAATPPPTAAEVTTMRDDYARQVDQIAFVDKQGVSVIEAKRVYAVGTDPMVSAMLGAAAGTFLGALAAVGAGAGRRRPRSPRELMALAPDLVVRTTAQAGELAGRLLETGRRSLVVLALPGAGFAGAQLAMAVAHHVRTHGATVAIVDRLSDGVDDARPDERLWALRRDVRLDVPANFSADVVVIGCPADEEALSLIAGQSDLLVVVVARRRGSVLALIRRTVDAVRISEPVVVLAS
jgi:hypothetical protein